MKNVGNVIFVNRGAYVITEMQGFVVTNVERLEDYVAKCYMIEHEGERTTLFSIIERLCKEYMTNNKVVE